MIALWTDIASSDERALYLAWLLGVQGVQQGEIDDGATEPAPPDSLGTPSPALESFIDIMGLDQDLVGAAVEGAPQASAVPRADETDRWIAALDDDQVALLSRVARGQTGVGTELLRRFRRQEPRLKAPQSLRTAGALRARAEELAEQRRTVILAREANRLESLLEEAHIKVSSLVSDLLGTSARRMLQALVDGEKDLQPSRRWQTSASARRPLNCPTPSERARRSIRCIGGS